MPGRQIPGRVAIFLDEKACAARFQKINRTAEAAKIIAYQPHFQPHAVMTDHRIIQILDVFM